MNNYPEWRTDKRLKGRFHEEYPDDLQVIVHDGGPRVTDRKPEVVWVRVTGCDNDIFQGNVLNQPFHLQMVKEGDSIKFIIAEGIDFPLYVSEKYIEEKEEWVIRPCVKCGFSELFDPPSELAQKITPPRENEETIVFTTFSCKCGGARLVSRKEFTDADVELKTPPEWEESVDKSPQIRPKAGCGLGILATFVAIVSAIFYLVSFSNTLD
ncbi:hypothetical protein ACFLXY_08150 [Chloroflexota bacterium]